MSSAKSERLINLAYLLLSSRRPLTRDEIYAGVDGYLRLAPQGRERTFERDKDDLRQLGVELSVVRSDENGVEGYWLDRSAYELPAVEFTPAETAVLGIAAHVWGETGAAHLTTMALAKLRAGGTQISAPAGEALRPVLGAREPGFDELFTAWTQRQAVQFTYRGGDEVRTVEPWSMTYRNGSWYLIAHDRGRDDLRCFKLARLSSVPTVVGRGDAYVIPADHDPAQALEMLSPGEHTDVAIVAVRDGHAPSFTRRGREVSWPKPLPEGFRAWQVPYNRHADIVGDAAAAAGSVVVLAPAELRAAVIEHLRVWDEAGVHS